MSQVRKKHSNGGVIELTSSGAEVVIQYLRGKLNNLQNELFDWQIMPFYTNRSKSDIEHEIQVI